MLRSIVVPLDGTPFSEGAVRMAARLLEQGGTLHLVHMHSSSKAVLAPEVAGLSGIVDSEIEVEEQAYLDGVARRITAAALEEADERGPVVITRVLRGDVVHGLKHYAHDIGADLVVMKTHGRTGVRRLWFGSVTDAVVRDVDTPVLVLRADSGGWSESGAPFRNVLIPLDGSQLSEAIMRPALELGGRQATYTLIQITHAGAMVGEAYVAAAAQTIAEAAAANRARAERYLLQVAARLRAAGYRVTTAAFTDWTPAAAVLEYAKSQCFDLIAAATHGRSGLKRLAFGSVGEELVRGSACPVLLYHPDAAADATAAAVAASAAQA